MIRKFIGLGQGFFGQNLDLAAYPAGNFDGLAGAAALEQDIGIARHFFIMITFSFIIFCNKGAVRFNRDLFGSAVCNGPAQNPQQFPRLLDQGIIDTAAAAQFGVDFLQVSYGLSLIAVHITVEHT